MGKVKILTFFLIISIFINAFAFYWVLKYRSDSEEASKFEMAQKTYPYLSKRILHDFPQDILINFLDLRSELRKQVEPYNDSFGFYFEYLPTGTTIGVNEKNEFYAASLFKVPAVMAYYRKLERTNNLKELDTEVVIEESDIDTQWGQLWKKGAGSKIKMSEAIRLALEESDNTATQIIAKRIDEEDFQAVYQALDIDLLTGTGGAKLTAKNYSSILKALYFSAVLEKKDSDQILNYLDHTLFNEKLRSGVPTKIPVAHKIGEYEDIQDKTKKAYMDCGIVYLPRRPYALCMISVGSEEEANTRMGKLSQTIYSYVSSK